MAPSSINSKVVGMAAISLLIMMTTSACQKVAFSGQQAKINAQDAPGGGEVFAPPPAPVPTPTPVPIAVNPAPPPSPSPIPAPAPAPAPNPTPIVDNPPPAPAPTPSPAPVPAPMPPPVAINPAPAPAPAPSPQPVASAKCTPNEDIVTILQNAQFCYMTEDEPIHEGPNSMVKNSGQIWEGWWTGFHFIANPHSGDFYIEYPTDGDKTTDYQIQHGSSYVGATTSLTVGNLTVDMLCYHMCP